MQSIAGTVEETVKGVRDMKMLMSQSSRMTGTWAHDGGGKTWTVRQANASLRAGRMRYRACFRDCEQ